MEWSSGILFLSLIWSVNGEDGAAAAAEDDGGGENPNEIEIYILISGGASFGAHPGKMYKDVVKDTLKALLELDVHGGTAKAAVIYGKPKKDENSFEYVQTARRQHNLQELTTDFDGLQKKTAEFLGKTANVEGQTIYKGISGVDNWIAEEVNKTESPLGPEFRVLIALLHFEISEKETAAFLDPLPQSASSVYMLVYPWAKQPCSSDVKRTVKKIKKFNLAGAYCGADSSKWSILFAIPTTPAPTEGWDSFGGGGGGLRGRRGRGGWKMDPNLPYYLAIGGAVGLVCFAGPMALWCVQQQTLKNERVQRRRTLSEAFQADHHEAIMQLVFHSTFHPQEATPKRFRTH